MTEKRVLLLHAYSSDNRGDGLLVDESLSFIREAYGADTRIDLVTSYPDSFQYTNLRTFKSKPSRSGYSRSYLRLLVSRFGSYDAVVGVGGGYLRLGTPVESLKTLVVMGPQLIAAALSPVRTVYLPQSIGPARFGFRAPLRALIRRLDKVWVRDDRSLAEFQGKNVHRASDMALLSMKRQRIEFGTQVHPVMSVREHRGSVPERARLLANRFERFDGYVQSAVAGNDDTDAVASLRPEKLCTFTELMVAPTEARVIVAVRLHAALMALAAGHYVIHLAYERKGFGAFEDLGLGEFVFNVHNFDVQNVEDMVRTLLCDRTARQRYDTFFEDSKLAIQASRRDVLASLDPSTGNNIIWGDVEC